MTSDPKSSVDLLLSRLDRVRGLARRLVRDAAEADDLVQEALAAAMSRPTVVHGAGDGWIAATLRNLMRDRARGARRRGGRERVAARPESGGSDTSLLVENAERQRDVVEAVLALDDPYRETLLMRFFEDLPPREIVKRTGRDSATVKKHIERGLAQVRAKLEARYGGRGAWAVALLPVVGRDGLGALGGAVTASTALRAAAVLLVVLGVGVPSYLIWRGAGATSSPEASGEVARLAEDVDAETLVAIDSPVGRATTAAPAHGDHAGHSELSTFVEIPPVPEMTKSVRLVGMDGQAIADRTVHWSPILDEDVPTEDTSERTFETDATGRGSLSFPSNQSLVEGRWRVDGAALAVAGEYHRSGEVLIVLAPAVRIAGRVLDHDGNPVDGATVTAQADVRTVPGFALDEPVLPSSRIMSRMTSAGGSFSFTCLPSNPAFRFKVVADGYRDAYSSIPQADQLDLELKVGRKKSVGRSIAGTVLESNGAPLADAAIRFGWHDARSDAQGRFRIQVPFRPGEHDVSAQASDGRFVVAPSPVESDEPDDSDTDGVVEDALVLRMPAAMNSLRGRLVDASGDPVVGFEVIVFNGTRRGSSTGSFEVGGSPSGIETDDEGRFVIDQVAERPYRLRFLDVESMLVHDAGPLDPGPTEHSIILPADLLMDVLRGHVVDVFGVPVRGAQVELRTNENPGDDRIVSQRSGRTTTTDDDGRFEVTNAPWRHISIVVNSRPGTGYAGVATPIGDRRPREVIEIEVDIVCNVHLSVTRDDVTWAALTDAEGKSLTVMSRESGRTTDSWRVRRGTSGAFPLFYVSQRAATLVLNGVDGEIERIPVRFETSGQNELDL